jgi:hypothetical protein
MRSRSYGSSPDARRDAVLGIWVGAGTLERTGCTRRLCVYLIEIRLGRLNDTGCDLFVNMK